MLSIRSRDTPPAARRADARRGLVLMVIALLAALITPGVASAQDGKVELALRPVDAVGQFFDVTIRPGEKRHLEVELANVGESPISARTYAADVYTIINGGFGARLRDEPQTGTTRWLDYSSDVLQLPPDQSVRRTFTITVPAAAEAGEYITSLVLENDEPIRGSGDVAIDQVVRQATAVVVTVPGPRTPALVIGAASHTEVAARSVVAVALENTGNVRLKPVADLSLLDANGIEVSRATVAMDSFYAHSSTLVEVPLVELLRPGDYVVRFTVRDDAHDVEASATAIPLIVEGPQPPDAVDGEVPGLAEVLQPDEVEGDLPDSTDLPEPAQEGAFRFPVALGILALSLVAAGCVAALIVGVRRRRAITTPR